MSILRIFAGSNDKETRLRQLIKYIASPEKKSWGDISFEANPHIMRTFGLSEEGSIDELYASFVLPHIAYGYPGTRLCYHCLIDFNGVLGASDAGYVAWQINQFLRQHHVQFLQGVHVTKGQGKIFWPHVHILINTIVLVGFNQGRKFRIDKPTLRSYKEYMNDILVHYQLPIISLYDKEDQYGNNSKSTI